jgi:hypothetical protein
MQRDGWSLIHNGVVNNHGEKYQKNTSNDSEDVLFKIIQGIDAVEADLSGYYAFAAIDTDGLLHIARDEYATLFIAWSAKFDTFVIGTTEELVYEFGKQLNLKLGPIEEVPDCVYIIMKGNAVVHKQEIVPYGWSVRESRHAKASLGREIGPTVVRAYAADDAPNAVTDLPEGAQPDSEGLPFGDVSTDEKEFAERGYNEELRNMDAAYTILSNENVTLDKYEFFKLDQVSKDLCTIVRPDGSIMDREDVEYYLKQVG